MKAHQRIIRESEAASDPRPVLPLSECVVEQVSLEQAKPIILRYEWLGTMPSVPQAAYGLRHQSGELLGVSIFGQGNGTNSKSHICGPDWIDKTICLERGACVHYAHEHAGSFLTARACKLAAQDYGWRVFYAYADPEAGEFGTIYQACNWLYVGNGRKGTPHKKYKNDWTGEEVTSRVHRRIKKSLGYAPDKQGTAAWCLERGWRQIVPAKKTKYVHFEGNRRERKKLLGDLRLKVLTPPKRSA